MWSHFSSTANLHESLLLFICIELGCCTLQVSIWAIRMNTENMYHSVFTVWGFCVCSSGDDRQTLRDSVRQFLLCRGQADHAQQGGLRIQRGILVYVGLLSVKRITTSCVLLSLSCGWFSLINVDNNNNNNWLGVLVGVYSGRICPSYPYCMRTHACVHMTCDKPFCPYFMFESALNMKNSLILCLSLLWTWRTATSIVGRCLNEANSCACLE